MLSPPLADVYLTHVVSGFVFSVRDCVPASVRVSWAFSLTSPTICLFCSILTCFYFILLHYLLRCLFVFYERKEWWRFGWGNGEIWERGNCNQNILYEKNLFSMKTKMCVCVSVMLPSSCLPGTYPELRHFRAECVFNDEASGFQVHIKDKDQ